jgi:hypothetical protein
VGDIICRVPLDKRRVPHFSPVLREVGLVPLLRLPRLNGLSTHSKVIDVLSVTLPSIPEA